MILHGDCLEKLKTPPDNSVDALVTDPLAGIAFMGKDWDKDKDKGGRKEWVAWMEQVMRECMRVMKESERKLVEGEGNVLGDSPSLGDTQPRGIAIHPVFVAP